MGKQLSVAPLQFRLAAGRAVAALQTMQRPGGELPTCTAPDLAMAGARAYPCSVYTTTFAIHALRRHIHLPGADETLRRAGAHLRAQRNPDGSWSYEGRLTRRVPPDLDDTACAVAALLVLGERPDLSFYRLLWEQEATPGGPYYTWVGVNGGAHLLARQVDALVNTNLLFCAALLGQPLPGALAYILDITKQGLLDASSVYTFTPHLLVYVLARAYADGPLPELEPALRAGLALLGDTDGVPFHTACRANALLALGAWPAANRALEALLASQGPDGAWPIAAAYSGYPPHHDGSPALTTAIALDALGRAEEAP